VSVYRLDPLQDPRWSTLLARHPRASVFHTRQWLDALRCTYGYQPVAFTTCAPAAELRDAVVFCEIQSWLTGSRLVSLPFSDHCDPLLNHPDQFASIRSHMQEQSSSARWQYIELRPSEEGVCDRLGFDVADEFLLHALDLRPEIAELFHRFHKSSTQRKVLRAQREGVDYQVGRSTDMLREFYRLLVLTRQRHGLPPQPFAWFENLAERFGDALRVRIASHRGHQIAAMVTIQHGSTLTYKYGASDAAWHKLGGVHLLFWNAIQEAHADGCVRLDLGRTDLADRGLATFKERWGATAVPLQYWRFRPTSRSRTATRDWVARCGARTAGHVPERLRVAAGRVLYKHLG
jgi:CelD/BcsL family acetyltransferase involved in cellulose biosynthesis